LEDADHKVDSDSVSRVIGIAAEEFKKVIRNNASSKIIGDLLAECVNRIREDVNRLIEHELF